jgi:hypothetical protein
MDQEMSCDPKAYQGICQNKMAYIRTELRGMGLTFPDEDEGRIYNHELGVDADFRYTPHSEELWLMVKMKPFFIPCAFIFSRLENAIENYRDPAVFDTGPDPF